MAHKKNNTNLIELLLQCMTQPDPMLSMLEWLCTQLMEAEVDQQLGAEKASVRTAGMDTAADTVPTVWTPARERCQGAAGRLYPVLRHGAQAQRGYAHSGSSGGLRAGRIHPEDGEAGTESRHRKPVQKSGLRDDFWTQQAGR